MAMHRAASTQPDRLPITTVIDHLWPPIVMGLVMCLAYLGGFHKPAPHDVPVAVVGTTQQAGAVAAGLEEKLGKDVHVTTVPSAAEATDKLKHLELAAAYVPSPTTPKLLTAPAASDSTNSFVLKVFTAAAAQQGKPLAIEEVTPLDPSDPIGQNTFFYMVALSVSSYATGIAIAAAGATRRFRERLGLAVVCSAVIASLHLGVASALYGMFPGHGFGVWAVTLAYCTTIMGICVGLHTLLGRLCTMLFSAMFVALNFTSSGGVFAPVMQPGFFGWLNQFWIGAGFLGVLRHILYFPEAPVAHAAWILVGWALFACLCLAVAHYVGLRREHIERLNATNEALRNRLDEVRRDGLTGRQAMELELEEDVAV